MLKGYICPDGSRVSLDHCFSKCGDRCMELPLLLGAASDREITPWQYHVTEIIRPPQLIWLSRNRGYYVEPKRQLNLMLGTAIHSYVEKQHEALRKMGLGDDYAVEEPLSIVVDVEGQPVTIVGRIDQYQYL